MWAFGGLVLGVIGWFVTRFLFEPFKEVSDLRRETQEVLIIHGNLSKDAPPDERRSTSDAFRRVGAALVARHLAAWPWVTALFKFLGWDVHSAGEMLISIGNSTQFDGFSMASLSPPVTLIRECL